jgi:hypothetical protein
MATSNNGSRYYFTGGGFTKMRPEDMAAFREGMQREFARQRQEREMPGSNNDQRREKVDPKTGRKFKNLNHPIPPRKERLSNQVVIHHMEREMPGTYHVTLPRRGRLGDLRILDETGRPINIGPTPRGPSEFQTLENGLDHFRRVSKAFDRLNGVSS